MIKLLRISSIYPYFLNEIEKNIFLKSDDYIVSLNKIFAQKYSVSNYITKALIEKNYECIEIINNAKFLQEKWVNDYGDSSSSEDILIQQIKYYKPDILYIGNASLADSTLIKKIRKFNFVKLILCFHCAPFTPKIIKNLRGVDAVVTCTKGYQELISREIDKDVLLMQHAFNPKQQLNSHEEIRDIDISFIGSLFINKGLHLNRVELIYELMKKFKNNYIAINFSNKFFLYLGVLIFKSIIKFDFLKKISFFYKLIYVYCFSKKPIFGNKMLKILTKTKILVNTHIEDTKYAGNMRLFEGTGCGCLLITDKKKDIDKLFKPNEEIELFSDKEDLIEKCKYYLINQDKLRKISKAGLKKTLSFHSYKIRASLLSNFIKKNIRYHNQRT
jgi:hypothetical protein